MRYFHLETVLGGRWFDQGAMHFESNPSLDGTELSSCGH